MTAGVDLTVIVPVHNGDPLIIDQLDAVVRSTRSIDAEVVIVDNRSTDGTRSAVEKWAARSDIVSRLVDADERQGEPYARNIGAREASAPLIAYCDADDIVGEGWGTAVVEALGSGAHYVTGPVDVDRLNPPWLRDVRGRRLLEQLPLLHGVIPFAHGCNMAFRADFLAELGGFDESIPMGCDIELGIRAWRAGAELTWAQQALVHYRLRPTLRATYRQGRTYGRARPFLRSLVPDVVEASDVRRERLRRMAWLGKSLPRAAVGRAQRARWVWVAAQLVGELRGEARRVRR
jgi:glycosyltransferase involved in cell wall biosynthesis